MAYPVARIRSMISNILRRFALWVGSDRPTPRGPAVVPCVSPIGDTSDVAVKELIDGAEGVLLLWSFKSAGPLRFQPDTQTRRELERNVLAAHVCHDLRL